MRGRETGVIAFGCVKSKATSPVLVVVTILSSVKSIPSPTFALEPRVSTGESVTTTDPTVPPFKEQTVAGAQLPIAVVPALAKIVEGVPSVIVILLYVSGAI